MKSLRRLQAFTLVEILVVLAILIPLISIALTNVAQTRRRAVKLQARSSCVQLQTALANFHGQYGRFPVLGDGEGPYSTDADLMDVLMGGKQGEAHRLNPKGTDFLPSPPIARSPTSQGWVPDLRQLNDPWGRPFRVYLDADDDGMMSTPPDYEGKFGAGRTRRIMVCSAGPDGKHETVADNVTSWD